MSGLPYRGAIALAAVLVALATSRPAHAQIGAPGLHRQHGGLVYKLVRGAWFEHTDRTIAEWHIQHSQERLRRDAGRGDSAAAAHEALWIDRQQNRIMVDDWLMQKELCDRNGYYPFPVRLDQATYCAISQYHTPPRPPGRW